MIYLITLILGIAIGITTMAVLSYNNGNSDGDNGSSNSDGGGDSRESSETANGQAK